jgi:hypothetical protein
MDSIADHLAKASRNWDSLRALRVNHNNADWAIVMLEYVALHLIDAFIHRNKRDHGRTHGLRWREIEALLKDGALSKQAKEGYEQLHSRSRAVRYEEPSATVQDFAQLVKETFRPLEAELLLQLPNAPKLPVLSVEQAGTA